MSRFVIGGGGREHTLAWKLAQSETVSLSVYDLSGRLVSDAAAKEYARGLNTVSFDFNHLNDGVYILQMKTKEGVYTRRLVKA